MKRLKILPLILAVCLLAGCGKSVSRQKPQSAPSLADSTQIVLSDTQITVDGKAISQDTTAAVYAARDIVYYESGKDFTYGEGTEADAHTREEADSHTVVHITQPGVYTLTGKLSAGQVAVDLGEDAEDDPEAVVTLVLGGVDVTCTVAPAVIFYNVYECGSKEAEDAVMEVDTAKAGANVVIADGTENFVQGGYVARIYKSVELSEDGTEVVDSKKLHKYDGAFYSKMSMNLYGGSKGDGILNITAQNEGLDSELHLTQHGGNIRIRSGNDGINTNEDGISVTSIRGGTLDIVVTGETGEGDGIDSNGWLVIDGGKVTASACATSQDSGIDADNGVYIRGGTVVAAGNMQDRFEAEQTSAVFSFLQRQSGENTYALKQGEETVLSCAPANAFQYLILSCPDMIPGDYTFNQNDVPLSGYENTMQMGGQMHKPTDDMSAFPNDMEAFPGDMGEPPEGMGEFPGEKGEPPEGVGQPPEGMEEPPEGMEEPPGGRGESPEWSDGKMPMEATSLFAIQKGANSFMIL